METPRERPPRFSSDIKAINEMRAAKEDACKDRERVFETFLRSRGGRNIVEPQDLRLSEYREPSLPIIYTTNDRIPNFNHHYMERTRASLLLGPAEDSRFD